VSGKSGSAFLRFDNSGANARARLVCFAHAGGTASVYAQWPKLLAPTLEVIAVELPGHGTRLMEEPLDDVLAMAKSVAEEFVKLGPKPFAFYGHSLGGLVAYETARLLAQMDAGVPVHLFVGASRPPHAPPVLPAISHLEREDFLEAVQERYGGIPDAVLNEPELIDMVLPAMQGDFVAYEWYRHAEGVPPEFPITAFVGSEDPVVGRDLACEWERHTSGPFQLQVVPGDHFFLGESRETVLAAISTTVLRTLEHGATAAGGIVQVAGR